MTLEEAKKVAAIASTADNECSVCVRDLTRQLRKAFPEFDWEYNPVSCDPIRVTLKQPT